MKAYNGLVYSTQITANTIDQGINILIRPSYFHFLCTLSSRVNTDLFVWGVLQNKWYGSIQLDHFFEL